MSWLTRAIERKFKPEGMVPPSTEDTLRMLIEYGECKQGEAHYKVVDSLKKKGLIECAVRGPRRGSMRITEDGRRLVQMIDERNNAGHFRSPYERPFEVYA